MPSLNSTGTPSKIALLQGGIPITSPTTTIGTANQVLAFTIQPDPALDSNIPFIRSSVGVAGATVSPLYLVTPTGTLQQDPSGITTSRALQASLAINGTATNQQSVIVANIGLVSDAAPQLIGSLRGVADIVRGYTNPDHLGLRFAARWRRQRVLRNFGHFGPGARRVLAHRGQRDPARRHRNHLQFQSARHRGGRSARGRPRSRLQRQLCALERLFRRRGELQPVGVDHALCNRRRRQFHAHQRGDVQRQFHLQLTV